MFEPALDNPKTYSKLDKNKIYDSIVLFRDQIIQAWTEVSNTVAIDHIQKASNIVVAGMGGSAFAGHIIRSLDQAILKVPMETVSNYRLPAYVNNKTLVVISSYSGNTEESISCLKDAVARKAYVFIIATGGKLAEIASKKNIPSYIFNPVANPAVQPRMGVGYSVSALLALLTRAGFLHVRDSEIQEVIDHLHTLTPIYERGVPLKKNSAKALASKIAGKAVMVVAANHLTGAAHVLGNCLNENAKTYSAVHNLPELNHHLLEGMSFPVNLKQSMHIIFINSDLYPKIISQRLSLTQSIFNKIGYPTTIVKPQSSAPLTQVFESLYFSLFLSYYTALLNKIDPGPIPWVDYFKVTLNKNQHKI